MASREASDYAESLGFDADRAQQKGRQVAHIVPGLLRAGLRGRRPRRLVPRLRLAGMLGFGGGFLRRFGHFRRALGPRNAAADQPLDGGDSLVVIARRDDGDGDAALAGAAGTADAMDVIIGMVRYVEIEDVADVRD